MSVRLRQEKALSQEADLGGLFLFLAQIQHASHNKAFDSQLLLAAFVLLLTFCRHPNLEMSCRLCIASVILPW